MTVLHGMYPLTAVKIPCLNTAFETAAVSASGIAAGLKALGREDLTVVSWAGDGGTYDIGIQALSGTAERGDNILHVCYDNEGYMNTGTHRSGATPLGSLTTTTPLAGKRQHKKDMIMIMIAHRASYIATVSSSYPLDLFAKFKKAKEKKGTRYIEIFCPCPPGWGFDSGMPIEMGRMAVKAGVFPLLEWEDESLRFNPLSAQDPDRATFDRYVGSQSRFRTLNAEDKESLWREVLSRRKRLQAFDQGTSKA
jgi:pyruvate ferredoxin oxidoreductase beta subunit